MAIYMSLGDAQGDVTAASNVQWIELFDVRWGLSRSIKKATGAAKNRESSTLFVGEVTVTKRADSASATIQQYAFKAIVNDCTIQYLHTDIGGGKVFRSLQFDKCMVAALTFEGGHAERPLEELTLNFTEVTVSDITYTDQESEGQATHAIYSLERATPL